MNRILLSTAIFSYFSFFIWSLWQRSTQNMFSILDIVETLSITCCLSILSCYFLFYDIHSYLHETIVVGNVISWFICSINLPITFIQCNGLSIYSCYYELSSVFLSFINFCFWLVITFLKFRNSLKYIILLCNILIIYNGIIYDILIYMSIVNDDYKRYRPYKINDSEYVLVKFNKFYIQY